MHKVEFVPKALNDFAHWEKTDYKIALKISSLIDAIAKDPFSGIGKPEPLRHQYAGCWSRRITDKDRLVYQIEQDKTVTVLTCRGHYTDK